MSESLRIVNKWLNEEAGPVPRVGIAELCAEIRKLKALRKWVPVDDVGVLAFKQVQLYAGGAY